MNNLQRIDRRPLYLQVHDVLLNRIAVGQWKPGDAIPAEGILAEELDVSVGTLRKALELLEDGHVIVRQQGRGTFVADYTNDASPGHFMNLRTSRGCPMVAAPEILTATCGPATETEAERLALVDGAKVLRRHCLRRSQDRVFSVECSVLPLATFPELAVQNAAHWEIHNLAQLHGVIVGKMIEHVTCRPPPIDASNLLAVPVGQPVLTLDRTVYSIEGEPIEWRIAFCQLGDGYYLHER